MNEKDLITSINRYVALYYSQSLDIDDSSYYKKLRSVVKANTSDEEHCDNALKEYWAEYKQTEHAKKFIAKYKNKIASDNQDSSMPNQTKDGEEGISVYYRGQINQ